MPAPTLSKHTRWGFALQTAFGTPNTTAGDINWLPYDGNLTFGHAGALELLDVSDGRDSPSEALPTGDWGEGDIGGPLYADADAMAGFFGTGSGTSGGWVNYRDAYNQPKYASVYTVRMVEGTTTVEGWQDVAIRQFQLELRARSYVRYTLSLLAVSENLAHGVSAPDIVDWGVPYNFDAAAMKAAWAGGVYGDDTTMKSATIVHDNMLEDIGECFTCSGSLSPTYLFASGGFRASLDLDRKYLDDDFFTEFKDHLRSAAYREVDGETPSLGFQFVITGTTVLTVTLPCVVLNDHPRSWPSGTASVVPETMRASALRSADGATDPIDWALT